MNRDDLSNKLIHFTKGERDDAIKTFHKILQERVLLGGAGNIDGGFKCVCFSESPISKLPHILADREYFEFPYAPLGIMVDKPWLFSRGGRPVIYQPKGEFDGLPLNIRWRHKTYDPIAGVDCTWEREWRIPIDTLPLDPQQMTVIVPDRRSVENFKTSHTSSTQAQIRGVLRYGTLSEANITDAVQDLPWHFIALEDLGVKVDW